ncbi:uncharacterized protein LOC117809835 [Notolabrus celidotus]|uniref:uncharacterized protein LOC117809835 n=1 Tax=Notolabrus celidotus TaxID=1203425 RepID=UPI00148FD4B5|nr:uncharacterized protein LOC117809835 [Notolabrus celidotus]XP_034535245.1 uncharacterized protein LOC117809835 [Notolabrus celidotus]XP_034535246.1 uncharacterized protein LOC117809835 [Notolabrus celidotus]
MQNRNSDRIIPEVRYHPSIQMPGNTGQTKTRTSPTQKARPAPVRSPRTQTIAKRVQENPRVDPDPSVGPLPGPQRVQRAAKKPNQKPVQRAAPDPGPPQRPVQHSDGTPPTPDQVSLDLEVRLDRRVIEEVETLTRGQRTNQDWFAWRKNRITASVAHRIAHCRFVNGKSQAPPTSYLAAITGEGPRIQTRAMSWGVQREAEAVQRYQELKSDELGRSVLVQDCGLFIDAQRSWLAASPDGIVTDGRTGQWLLCLEVKCPYKHRHHRVEDACREDPAFCLRIQDEEGQQPGGSPVYHLKRSHSYYTQVQCQLAVTGLQRADFVVFTLKETAIVPVTFDPDLWEETVSDLELFYREAVLPHLREKTQQRPAAAWRPEL